MTAPNDRQMKDLLDLLRAVSEGPYSKAVLTCDDCGNLLADRDALREQVKTLRRVLTHEIAVRVNIFRYSTDDIRIVEARAALASTETEVQP